MTQMKALKSRGRTRGESSAGLVRSSGADRVVALEIPAFVTYRRLNVDSDARNGGAKRHLHASGYVYRFLPPSVCRGCVAGGDDRA